MPSLGPHTLKLLKDHQGHGLARVNITKLIMSQVLDGHETLGIGLGHANNIYYAF
jgi:hypothetical protein